MVSNSERKTATGDGVSSQRVAVLDDFDVCSMRRIIHGMYVRGDNVTLDIIKAALLSEMEINVSR